MSPRRRGPDSRTVQLGKAILFVLLTGGFALMYYGFGAYTSASSVESDVARFFTGSSADASLGLLGGGVVATLIGAGGLLGRVKGNRSS